MIRKLSLLIVGIFALSACQQDITLDTAGKKFKHHNEASCLIDELEANPAAYHRSGSSNGMAFKDGPIYAQYLSDASSLAQQVDMTFPGSNLKEDRVLIVADDFGAAHNQKAKSVYKLHSSLYKMSYADFESPLGLASTYAAMNEHFQTMVEEGKLSHGAQVLTLTLDVFSELGAVLISMTDDQIILKLSDQKIIVQAVEVGGMDTAAIKQAIEQAIATYQMQGYEEFVVNMSWTLEPCKAVETFRRKAASSFDKFLTKAPASIGPGDPLYDYLNAANNRQIIFTAAAGNFGGNQPRQPGKMPRVISTSAAYANTSGFRAEFSNYGEVMMNGAYFRLGDPYNRNGIGQEANAALLVGSSYAVIGTSIASLLDAGSSVVRCGFDAFGPRLAHGAFSNSMLSSAVASHCLP